MPTELSHRILPFLAGVNQRGGSSPRARRKFPLQIGIPKPTAVLWSLKRRPDDKATSNPNCGMWRAPVLPSLIFRSMVIETYVELVQIP
jgi:hypothetical protein